LDTWALVDADSNEEKQFASYMNYWEALAGIIVGSFGTEPVAGLRDAFDDKSQRFAKKFRALSSKQFAGDSRLLRTLLLGAWNSELGLYLVDEEDDRLMHQNQWNNVFAYYASSKAALAWTLVRDNAVPTTHRSLLDAMAAQAGAAVSLFPVPWSLCCTCCSGRADYSGFANPPRPVSNLTSGGDPFDLTAKFLKTTRQKRLDERKKQDHPKRAPNGYRARLDGTMPPTSVFDFLWRSRTRANYGDPSMFYMGTLTQDRAVRFLRAVRLVTSTTMGLFEMLVGERAKGVLLDAADHFISRDRTHITQAGLAARLVEARLLKTSALT
jgi:hypothetical protein